MCLWKQWKNPRTKVKRLISLGVPKDISLLSGEILGKGIGELQGVQFCNVH